MIIRKNNKEDINTLVNLWYQTSVKAHNFVNRDYWKAAEDDMRQKYIPMSETYVIEEDNQVHGFVSMLDNYLAAIFVDHRFQSRGYGKELLNYIKEKRDIIKLKVFKKNTRACDFYLKNDFVIKEELRDDELNEIEYLMVWEKDNS